MYHPYNRSYFNINVKIRILIGKADNSMKYDTSKIERFEIITVVLLLEKKSI